MKTFYLVPVLGLAALLGGCGGQPTGNAAAPVATNTSGMSADMNMAAPASISAKGTGTVKAIDKAAGTITLDHGPIAEANWPAMTMAFKAAPALLDSVAVGDKVAFDLKLESGSGEVTAISKQ